MTAVVGESLGDAGAFGKDVEWTGPRARKPAGLRMVWVLGAVNEEADNLTDCMGMGKVFGLFSCGGFFRRLGLDGSLI
jgi:hypothetical protein